MNVNNVSEVKSKSNQDEVGTSLSNPNTTMAWNATCKRSLRSSRGSKPTQVSAVVPPPHSATGLKLAEQLGSNPAEKTAVPKDPAPQCNLRKEVETSQDSIVASVVKEIAQNAAMVREIAQKASLSNVPDSDIPVYHIRLDGHGEELQQFGEKCILCYNDLSCSPHGVDHGSRADDERKYRVKFIPQVLTAVDILPCGHAIHTECSKHVMSVESNVPRCITCLSMP